MRMLDRDSGISPNYQNTAVIHGASCACTCAIGDPGICIWPIGGTRLTRDSRRVVAGPILNSEGMQGAPPCGTFCFASRIAPVEGALKLGLYEPQVLNYNSAHQT